MTENTYLVHHGVKGMKWGVRRTPAQLGHRIAEKASAVNRTRLQRASAASARDAANLRAHGYHSEADAVQRVSDNQARKASGDRKPGMSTAKKVAIGAAAVAGVALAAYGAKKYTDMVRDGNAKYHAEKGKALMRVYRMKNDVRDYRRNIDISRAVDARGYTARKALAVQDADERVHAKTAERILGYERRKTSSDTFRQARKNAKAYRRMSKNGDVSDQLFKQELERHAGNYARNSQHPHNRRKYLNKGL